MTLSKRTANVHPYVFWSRQFLRKILKKGWGVKRERVNKCIGVKRERERRGKRERKREGIKITLTTYTAAFTTTVKLQPSSQALQKDDTVLNETATFFQLLLPHLRQLLLMLLWTVAGKIGKRRRKKERKKERMKERNALVCCHISGEINK